MPDDLKTLFQNSDVPAPRADLTDRIVAAALEQPALNAANDRRPLLWTALAGIAATLVAGLLVFNSQPSDTELWAANADAAGFGDLYEWVEGDIE
jgi:hypothetical protein